VTNPNDSPPTGASPDAEDRASTGVFFAGDGRHSGPVYQRGVWVYRKAGWRGVLPVPPGKKANPPVGFTGHDGRWPSDDDIAGFIGGYWHNSNLLLRVEYGSVGLDIDAYEGKTGGQTLAEAERRLGPLPPTWRSTSRVDDSVSGIRVFKVPPGMLFRGVIKFPELGIGDIEIIQPHHRGIAAWPSIKDGRLTRWFNPARELVDEGVVPRHGDWPELSAEWIEFLAKDSLYEEVFDGSALNRSTGARARVDMAIYQDLIDRLGDDRAPEALVADRLEQALKELTNGCGSRYDTTRDHVLALMRFHSYRRAGVARALDELYPAYVMEVGDTRPREVAEKEFERFTKGAALLVSSSMPDRNTNGEDASGAKEQQDESGSHWQPDQESPPGWEARTGAAFILDRPTGVPLLWGTGEDALWPDGEPLMVMGPRGTGKTTLLGQLVRAQLGLGDGTVLGLPVSEVGRVLYLAMDRPRQIQRSMGRQFTEEDRAVLGERLVVRSGPPPRDLAKDPTLLVTMADYYRADVVYVDSLKDIALGLSDDEVAAAVNRARQALMMTERQLCESHHTRKKDRRTKKAVTGIDEVYGSTWLTAGCGSVLQLSGDPGDIVVTFTQTKPVLVPVGPWKLLYDQLGGTVSIYYNQDLVELVRSRAGTGMTAREAAVIVFGRAVLTPAEVQKTRRLLDGHVRDGDLKCVAGKRGGDESRWFPA
jgi:hypothetical protein